MALAEASLHTLVGLRRPAPITAGLVLNGREVTTARPVTVSNWAADGPAVAGLVVFGPYNTPVSFDAVRLYHGGEQLIDLPHLPLVTLAPGLVFQEDVVLDATDG